MICTFLFSSLINHCKYSHADNQAQPVQPKSRKHKYHWDGGGGNGMKCNSNPELIPMHSNSFHGNQHYQSPKPYIKRSRLFFCCSKKGAKNRHHRGGSNGQGHVVNARYEREHIFEVSFKINWLFCSTELFFWEFSFMYLVSKETEWSITPAQGPSYRSFIKVSFVFLSIV